MSEQKELCPSCGNVDFAILRDMTSRRVCKCGHSWDAPEKNNSKELSKDLLSTVMDSFRKAEESALIEEIIRLSKEGHLHLVSLMPYIENEFENKLTIKSALRLETPKYNQLKSDYDDLKQLSDAFYLKQVQLENQNEELKYQLTDRSEKYKIAMDKGVDVLSSEIKDLKSKLEKAESVISFYASEDTWINKEFDEKNNLIGWTQKKPNDVSIFPYSIGNSNGNFHCLGRRAREYLKGEG